MMQDYNIPKDVWQATRYYFRAFLLVFIIALLACLLVPSVHAESKTMTVGYDGKAESGDTIGLPSYASMAAQIGRSSCNNYRWLRKDANDTTVYTYSFLTGNPVSVPSGYTTDRLASQVYCDGGWRDFSFMFMQTVPSWYTINATFVANVTSSSSVPLDVGFTRTLLQYVDSSKVNYSWSFGDGYTSTSANPSHQYTNGGYYTVSCYFSDPGSSYTKTRTNYIQISTLNMSHLDVDIKDNTTKAYIQNSEYGIYDYSASEWQNGTCDSGACGFIDSGTSHSYPLVYGSSYKLFASNGDYNTQTKVINFVYDHQLETFYLDYNEGNKNITTIRHLDVDIKSGQSLKYLEDANYQIYDPIYDVWHNSTCSNGACGWTYTGSSDSPHDLRFGATYGLYADKFGYNPTNKTLVFSYDHQLETLYLYPETVYNETAHLDIDVRYSNYTPVINANVGLYDYAYGEWRNGTSFNGSTGYVYSGTYPHAYPLKYYTTYKISISKDGYYPQTKDVVLSYDHQLFTFILYPTSSTGEIINTTITVLPTPPVYLIPNFTLPTPMPSPDINDTWIINITISPFPTINPYWNTTGMVNPNELKTNIDPFFNPWLNSIDFMFNNTFAYGLSILCFVLSPIITLGLYGVWTISMISGYQVVFSNYVIFVTYLVTAFVNSIPNKLRNTITFCLLLDIAYQLLTIKKAKL